MSDATEFSLPTIAKTIEGNTLTFGKISVTDRTRILRGLKTTARAQCEANALKATLSNEQVYTELSTFDDLIWGATQWFRYANSSDGQDEILRLSLKKANGADKVDALMDLIAMQHEDLVRLVCEIASLPFNESAPKVPGMKQVGVIDGKPVYGMVEPEGDGSANPTVTATKPAEKPKAYGQE